MEDAITRSMTNAHAEWLANKCQGEGRLVCKDVSLSDLRLMARPLAQSLFINCIIKEGFLSSVELDGAEITDCLFRETNLLLASLNGAIVKNTKFQSAFMGLSKGNKIKILGGEMQHCDLERCRWNDALFEGVNLTGSIFKFATLERSTFRDCILTDCDFSNVDLSSTTFENCVDHPPKN